MNAKGFVHKYGNNIDTDVIIPARYLNTQDHKELASHCMEDIDTDFVRKVSDGDIMVGGENFGCGSSREHAPIAIQALAASSRPPSRASSTATQSTSAFRFWNALRRAKASKPATRSPWILTPAS